MFGSHLSIAGGLANAIHGALRLKMDCVQVFTKNQRQWKAPALNDAEVSAWNAALREAGWHSKRSGTRTVSHTSYLINLASPDTDVRARSIELMRIEIDRCEALGIPCVVVHPGAHLGASRPASAPNRLREKPTADELAGLQRIIAALDQIHGELPGHKTVTCLETTVGSGTNLGYDFGQLKLIREGVTKPERLAYCFDTCHVTAAGYDLSTDSMAAAVFQEWDECCGLKHIRVVHCNDSVGACGSRKDRHAHIGHGTCGISCFRAIVNHPLLANVPKVLETPKEENARGIPWDTLNLRRLRRLGGPKCD